LQGASHGGGRGAAHRRDGAPPLAAGARSTHRGLLSQTLGWRAGLLYVLVMDEKVNLAEKFKLLDKPYSPGIIGYVNDYKLQIVKVKGEFVWHKHDYTDDFFLVLQGRLTIQLRDREVVLTEGELLVVPRGVEHCPKAEEETHVLLIEPRGTTNTGDVESALTAAEVEI
jgi:mannose-6-phosphate isomerase-like protein (cupin superfamily)